jgi:chemotaxis protein CheX
MTNEQQNNHRGVGPMAASETLNQDELALAIRLSTEEVFSTMLGLNLVVGDVYVAKDGVEPSSGVVSIVGFAGPWVGSGSLCCTGQFACKIASFFLQEQFAAVTEDVLDSVAELTNMIIGNVKTHLENRVGAMGLSTPTVIYGRNFQTRSVRNQEWTVVPFSLDGDRVCVQMCIMPNPDESSVAKRAGFPIPHVLSI